MNKNPFSPSFGIDPNNFYGRKKYLDEFERALLTPGAAERYFMLTGTRGCGKTSLLHQYALIASNLKWHVIEATNIDALDLLLHFVGLDKETTRKHSLSPTITLPSANASFGELSSSSTLREPNSLLNARLKEKLSSLKRRKGLLIIIDEAQKVKRDDIVRIGNAVQQAKNSGLSVALILGGLPSVYNKVRSYKDCTFLKRMMRTELWCMTKSESFDCLKSMFAKAPEIMLAESQVEQIWQFIGGHPYLLQLVGSNVYDNVLTTYAPVAGMIIEVDDELINDAEMRALATYKVNVLDDLFSGTHADTRRYIEAAYTLRDEDGSVKTSKINEYFGKTAKQMSPLRQYALNTQVIRKSEWGSMRFALPHYEYIFEDFEYQADDSLMDDWKY